MHPDTMRSFFQTLRSLPLSSPHFQLIAFLLVHTRNRAAFPMSTILSDLPAAAVEARAAAEVPTAVKVPAAADELSPADKLSPADELSPASASPPRHKFSPKNIVPERNRPRVTKNSRNKTPSKFVNIAPDPLYYFEDGLRKVYPYYFTYNTFCKERWRGKSLLEVFSTEFRDRPIEYYVCSPSLERSHRR